MVMNGRSINGQFCGLNVTENFQTWLVVRLFEESEEAMKRETVSICIAFTQVLIYYCTASSLGCSMCAALLYNPRLPRMDY